MKHLFEAVTDLETCALEAVVLWNERAQNAKEGLLCCVREYWISVRRRKRAAEDPRYKWKDGEAERVEAVVYGPDDDEFGSKVTQAVKSFEDLLRPHLRNRMLGRQ